MSRKLVQSNQKMVVQQSDSKSSRDPFEEEPLPKAHYHPSRQKKLSKAERNVTLSPNRLTKANGTERKIPSPSEEMFLREAHTYSTKLPPSKDQEETSSSKFDESWPSSERPSSLSVSGLEDQSPYQTKFSSMIDRYLDVKQTLNFPEKETPSATPRKNSKEKAMLDKASVQGGSVLQRYVERFRSGAPMSREERLSKTEAASRDFWWLSSNPSTPPTSSTPNHETPKSTKTKRFTPHSPISPYQMDHHRGQTSHGLGVPKSPMDEETRQLQEKADRLLEQSSSSLASSGPVVSTEGLGSSPSEMSSFEEKPYRPVFARNMDRDGITRFNMDMPTTRGPPTRPEDDVLYQWRLKRRMETARDSAQKAPVKFGFLEKNKTKQQVEIDSKLEEFKRKLAGKDASPDAPTQPHKSTGSIQFTPAPSSHAARLAENKIDPLYQIPSENRTSSKDQSEPNQIYPPVASPVLPRKSLSTDPPPHLHLMCDLLPCPHQDKYVDKFSELKTASDTSLLTESETSDPDKEKSDKKLKQYLQAEKPDIEKQTEAKHKGRSQKSRHDRDVSGEYGEDNSRTRQKTKVTIVDQDSPESDYVSGQRTDMKECREKEEYSRRKGQPKQSEILEETRQRQTGRRKNTKPGLDQDPGLRHGQRSRSGDNEESASSRPKHSSSPKLKRAVVDSTIGQVVKDHLFNMSSSTVASSMESLPSFISPETREQVPVTGRMSPQSRPPLAGSRQQEQDINEVDVYDSDGEFADDHLLQILRQQRSQHEEQLRQIDHLLSHLSTEGQTSSDSR